MFSITLIFVYISCVTNANILYGGLIRDDWRCNIAFEEYGNNCDQRIETVAGHDDLRCYSARLDNKGSADGASFPSNNRAIQLYHDDTWYNYHIIIGTTFHCTWICTFKVVLNGNLESALNLRTSVANDVYNMIDYIDRLFYTIYYVNKTHVTTSIYEGGEPDTINWDINNYDTYYGSGTVEINLSDPKTIQRLKYAHIRVSNGDTYNGREAWIEINYFAMDAEIIELHTEPVPVLNDWMQYVDSTEISWQYPVSYDGFNDVVSGFKNSNWGKFTFLDMINVNGLIEGHINKHDIIGFSVDMFVIVGNQNYNWFGLGGGWMGLVNRGWQNCWQNAEVFLYESLLNTTEYSKAMFTLEYGNSGSIQVYLRDFKWLYNKNCEIEGEIKHINWNELQNSVDNSAEIPYSNFSISLDEPRLELTFDIDLEYIGLSSDGNFDNDFNLPTTWVIDFQSFGTNGDSINEPGNCQNRLLSSFVGVANFTNYWGYSEYPYLSNELGTNAYLSYPAQSKYWKLSIEDWACTPINYEGIFSWKDLSECTDYDGNNLIDIIDDGTSITLSGTLYVNVISPYSMDVTDNGYYRSFPLIQQDFAISILKQINVIASTGVDLFITSIIGIYEDETDKSFELSILTQSADYIELINPNIISTPLGTNAAITSITSSCLVASSFTCGQIFTITIPQTEINCPPANFSGVYQMAFNVNCRNNEQVCNTFIDDNGGLSVALQVSSNFIDTTCEPELYQVIFEGNIEFYDDNQFIEIHDDQNGDNYYVIGQDTIYIQVEVIFPDDGSGDNFNIFGVEINNVFVCTADVGIDLTTYLNQQNGQNGGCLSPDIDDDGPYNVILNGVADTNYEAVIISSTGTSNIIQFSFLTFDIGRSTMYVHAQLTLILQNGQRRRLQLLQPSNNAAGSNQIRHFLDSTSIVNHTNIVNTKVVEEDITDNANWNFAVSCIILLISNCLFTI